MSRPIDQERGARLAAWQASEMLQAATQPNLFPVKLTRKQRELWQGIAAAAADELAYCQALRAANGG